MCEPYNAKEMAEYLLAIRMEVMNGDKHEANRMLISLSDVIYNDIDEEE